MLNVIFVALVMAYFLIVWLNTNAFVEYLTIFRLERFFYVEQYNELQRQGYEGNYINFLREYYDSFFVRLLSCPICLSFWIGLFLTSCSGPFGLVASPLTLFFYLVLNKML